MIMKRVWLDVGMKEMAATKNDCHAHVGVVPTLVAEVKEGSGVTDKWIWAYSWSFGVWLGGAS